MSKAVIGLLLFALAIASCRDRDPEPGPGLSQEDAAKLSERVRADEQSRRARLLGELRKKLIAATGVTEYRVVSPFNSDFARVKDSPRKYDSYPLIGQRTPTQKEARMLAEVLSEPGSYLGPEMESTCLPDPGYIVAFNTAAGPIEVIICFTCGDVWITGDKELDHTTLPIAPEARKLLFPRVASLAGTPPRH